VASFEREYVDDNKLPEGPSLNVAVWGLWLLLRDRAAVGDLKSAIRLGAASGTAAGAGSFAALTVDPSAPFPPATLPWPKLAVLLLHSPPALPVRPRVSLRVLKGGQRQQANGNAHGLLLLALRLKWKIGNAPSTHALAGQQLRCGRGMTSTRGHTDDARHLDPD
jgi:hypothetical protein